jgi:hypothetical protein
VTPPLRLKVFAHVATWYGFEALQDVLAPYLAETM